MRLTFFVRIAFAIRRFFVSMFFFQSFAILYFLIADACKFIPEVFLSMVILLVSEKSTGKENSKKTEKTKRNPPKKPTTQAEVSPTKNSFNDARFKKFMKCLNAVFEKYQLQDIAIDTVTLDFQSSYPEYDDNEIADYLLEMEERNQLMITDTRIYKISS